MSCIFKCKYPIIMCIPYLSCDDLGIVLISKPINRRLSRDSITGAILSFEVEAHNRDEDADGILPALA